MVPRITIAAPNEARPRGSSPTFALQAGSARRPWYREYRSDLRREGMLSRLRSLVTLALDWARIGAKASARPPGRDHHCKEIMALGRRRMCARNVMTNILLLCCDHPPGCPLRPRCFMIGGHPAHAPEHSRVSAPAPCRSGRLHRRRLPATIWSNTSRHIAAASLANV